MSDTQIESTLAEAVKSFVGFYRLLPGTTVRIAYRNKAIRALRGNKIVLRSKWRSAKKSATLADLRDIFTDTVRLDYRGMEVEIDVPGHGSNGHIKLKTVTQPQEAMDIRLKVFDVMNQITTSLTTVREESEIEDDEMFIVAMLLAIEKSFGCDAVERAWNKRLSYEANDEIIRLYEAKRRR